MEIRPCQPEDSQSICDIYSYYVENTVISFEEVAPTVAEMAQRIATCTETYPWLVCHDGVEIVGYAHAGKWQQRCAYRLCVESTVYLKHGKAGKGYGTGLYRELLAVLQRQGFHMAIAGIALPNEASVKLHEQCGFTKVAHFSEVGRKFDRWRDVGYWQKKLENDA